MTAAWDPAENSWRPLTEWPLRGRSSETLVWTGSVIIDVAASTAIEIGGGDTPDQSPVRRTERVVRRYGPVTRSWCSPAGIRPARRPGDVAPGPGSATAAAWLENRAIVVDSELNSAVYHPDTDSWSSLPDLPLPSLGCDPRIHTAGRMIIAEICGDIALLDTGVGTWMPFAPPGRWRPIRW